MDDVVGMVFYLLVATTIIGFFIRFGLRIKQE